MSDPVIIGKGLNLSYGKGEARVAALQAVNVELQRGAWTSIMGPSGSGKTTLLHVLSGLSVPDSGATYLRAENSANGKLVNLSDLSEDKRAALRRTDIGLIFQEFNLVPVLSVHDNIVLPMKLARRSVDKQWYGEIVERLGLGARLKHLPSELSGGQRQRVAIARALLARPSIIFADEPTGNLDSEAGAAVLKMFRELVNDYGQTLAVVTHDPAAAQYGDALIRMRDGQVSA